MENIVLVGLYLDMQLAETPGSPLLVRMAGFSLHADTALAPMTWVERLKRAFQIEIATCPECGGKLRVIADTRHGLVYSS